MEFPLFARELNLQARRIWPYGARILPAALSAGLLFFASLFEWAGSVPNPDDVSRLLLGVTDFCLFSAVVLVPPLLTAGLIAQEKQERTLGLLLLADFGGSDIALAKLVSPFLLTATLIFSTLPVLSVAAFFGGISVPGLAQMLGLYLVAGLSFCAFGLFCSTIANRPGDAFFTAIGGIVASLGGLYVIAMFTATDIMRFHPAIAAYAVDPSGGGPAVGIEPYILAAILSAVCVMLTIYFLPRQAHRSESGGRRTKERRGRRRRRPGMGPIYSRLLRSGSGGLTSVSSRPLRGAMAILLMFLGALPCVGSIFIGYLLAYDVASSFDVARRRGIFDDLRLTAPAPLDFLRGLFMAHLWRGLFFFPALLAPLVFLFLEPVSILERVEELDSLSVSSQVYAIVLLGVGLFTMVAAFAAQLLFLVAAASYHSRGAGRPSGHATATIVIYITLGLFLIFLIPLAIIAGSLGLAVNDDFAGVVIPAALGGFATLVFGFGAWLYYREYIARYLPYV